MKLDRIKQRDALIGLVILILLAIVVYFLSRPKLPNNRVTIATPVPEERIENRFNRDLPDDIEKAELSDVSGGTGSGIATRNEILVDLPDPESGKFYQAWLESAEGKRISLGKLRVAKGGWLITYNSASYPGYNKVVISLESVFDNTLEQKVLEGSFK